MLQIRQAKQEWEATVDALPELVCLLNEHGQILRVNRTVEHWGLGRVDTVYQQQVHQLLHPTCAVNSCALRCAWEQAWEQVRQRQTMHWETFDECLQRYIALEVRPILPAPPSARAIPGNCHAVLIVQDITPRKVTEQALYESEQRYRAMVEHGSALICTHTLDGTLLSVNPAASQALGYQVEECIGHNLRDFLVPSVRHQFDAYLQRLQQHPIDSEVMRVMTKAGEERFWAYRNVRCDAVSKTPYVIGHAYDITERLQMERALRDSEEHFRNLVEGSLQGIVICCNGRAVFANQAFATVFGYESPEDIFHVPTLWDLFAPGEQHRFQQHVQAQQQARMVADHGECQGRRRDGTVIWLDVKIRSVSWQGASALQATVFDITERKRAETCLTATLQQLERGHADMLALLQQLRLGTVMTDEAGYVTFVNAEGKRLLEYDSMDIMGQPWATVFPLATEQKAQLQAIYAQPAASRTIVSGCLSTPSGQSLWVDVEVQDDPRHPQRKIFLVYDRSEIYDLRRLLDDKARFQGMVGKSDSMLRVYRLVQDVAKVDATVLIDGETGTGKELVAQAIHSTSPRHAYPFVAVNCAALSESVLESQLFGHKRGAFTGAVADHCGLIETAHKGTLFLDEVGDIPPSGQIRLLRVLQEREIIRVGESTPRRIDVRIVAATQHDLTEAVQQGRFRADLLYRLRVVRITLPPLRERREDIPLLVSAFVAEARASTAQAVYHVSPEAMRRFVVHAWPGNVRELRSAIEFAAIQCRGAVIQADDLPPEVDYDPGYTMAPQPIPIDEHQRILKALEQTGGKRRQAARLLRMSKSTLYRRLADLGLSCKR